MEKHRLPPNLQAAGGRGGPGGWGCQCLPLLSGRWGWRNRGFEMPNPGSEQQQPGLESVGIAVASLTRSPVVGRGRRIAALGILRDSEPCFSPSDPGDLRFSACCRPSQHVEKIHSGNWPWPWLFGIQIWWASMQRATAASDGV